MPSLRSLASCGLRVLRSSQKSIPVHFHFISFLFVVRASIWCKIFVGVLFLFLNDLGMGKVVMAKSAINKTYLLDKGTFHTAS